MIYRIPLFFSIVLILLSCSEAKFQGGNSRKGNSAPTKDPLDLSEGQPKGPDGNPTDSEGNPSPRPGSGINPNTGTVPTTGPLITKKVFEVKCQDGVNVVQNFSAPEAHRIEAVVRGEICPGVTDKKNIMFLVDFSGSMGPHFDDDRQVESPGHDPREASGSCGRLRAVSAIVNRIQAQMKPGQNIDVSVVPFAEKAIGQGIFKKLLTPRSVNDFAQNYLTSKYLCRYVAQNEEHERRGESLNFLDLGFLSSIGPSTNYAAAFNKAQEVLVASQYPNSEIFFITDGEPTAPAPDGATAAEKRRLAREAGKKAGLALRNDKSIKNLVINGLYLGIKSTNTYNEAKGIIGEVTGSPKRVLPAENAEELAKKILEFPTPTVNANADDYSKMASLTVIDPVTKKQPYGEKNVGIRTLYEENPKFWTYETQSFYLLGLPGKEFNNQVNINIFGESGFLFKTTVNIMYKMK